MLIRQPFNVSEFVWTIVSMKLRKFTSCPFEGGGGFYLFVFLGGAILVHYNVQMRSTVNCFMSTLPSMLGNNMSEHSFQSNKQINN